MRAHGRAKALSDGNSRLTSVNNGADPRSHVGGSKACACETADGTLSRHSHVKGRKNKLPPDPHNRLLLRRGGGQSVFSQLLKKRWIPPKKTSSAAVCTVASRHRGDFIVVGRPVGGRIQIILPLPPTGTPQLWRLGLGCR